MTHTLTKEDVLRARADFFAEVLAALKTPPKAIDEKLEQGKYYHPPVDSSLIADADYGDFYIEINPVFGGHSWPLAYSMWQIGQELRIAIILQAHSEDAPWADPQEFAELWPESSMGAISRGEKQFLEWRFQTPDFHTNYAVRERFALGMRHLHFRTLKAIRALGPRS